MKIERLAKGKTLIRITTFIVITTLLCQNIALANGGSIARCLSGRSLFKDDKGQDQLVAVMVCETIEKRARYGKPIESICLNDLRAWAESSEEEFSGCRFEILPYEIRIHLPSDKIIVRYFTPSKVNAVIPYSDISKLTTRKINSRLNRQIIHLVPRLAHLSHETFISSSDYTDIVNYKMSSFSITGENSGLGGHQGGLRRILALIPLLFITLVSCTSMGVPDTLQELFTDIVGLLPSLGALLGGIAVGFWVLKQIGYGIDLWKKEPTYDLLSRVVPLSKEKAKESVKFAEYRYKVITGQPIKAIMLGIRLSDDEKKMIAELSSIKDDARRYMLYYGVKGDINKFAGIVTVRKEGRGIISVKVDWTRHEGKRQLSEDFVLTELANRNPAGIIFYSSDIDPDIMDRVLPNHTIADKKDSTRQYKEEVFEKLKIDDQGQYTFFALDRQDFKERRRYYFGSFKFSSLWKMAEIENWVYHFASGLFFALVFSSIFAYAEAIKILAPYAFFEEYLTLVLTVIVAPLAAISIAKVIRLRWDPVRARHGRREGESIWLSITQNMRMGWKIIGTYRLLAYSKGFLSAIGILLIPAIGVVILGIVSPYIYLGLMFLKLVTERIISEFEQRYYKEVAEVAILFNDAAKREGYAENFHNIDSMSDVFNQLIYACGLLLGYGIYANSLLTCASIPLAIFAVIVIPLFSFLVPMRGRDYRNYLKIWGRGFALLGTGKVPLKVLLADGVTMTTNPLNPLVTHPRPVLVTDWFSILPWVEQLGVTIKCAAGYKPIFKMKNPNRFLSGISAIKGRCVLMWPQENLRIELVSREMPVSSKSVVITDTQDGGCLVRFYPKKDGETPVGKVIGDAGSSGVKTEVFKKHDLAKRQKRITGRFIDTVKIRLTKQGKKKTILALDTNIGNMKQFEITEMLRQIQDVSSLLGDIEFVARDGEALAGVIEKSVGDLIAKGINREDIEVVVLTKREMEGFDYLYHITRVDDTKLEGQTSYVPILELLTFALRINLEDGSESVKKELREIYHDITGLKLTDDIIEAIRNGAFAIPLPPTEKISRDFYNESIEILNAA